MFRLLTINRHRFATDGSGITTLVALAGCPLKCKYCLNKRVLSECKVTNITEEDLLKHVIIDYCYFVATGGGITFGGGEPLLQSEAILRFIEILPPDIRVNIETSLNCDNEFVEDILNKVDGLIIDIKTFNSKVYKEYTGIDNEKTLKWLKFITDKGLQHKCLIRIPNITEHTTEKDIEEAIKKIKEAGFNNIDIFNYIIK